MKNNIEIFQKENIIAGSFPVVTDSLAMVTGVQAGDIIGVSSTNTFGKYDTVTYTEIFGIAYEAAAESTECIVILSGEISSTFIKVPEGKELEVKNLLRKNSIFIR